MSYRYKIIDASAGTGKTFSLRKNILLKLLTGDDFSFKEILALTFTNNASNEMKSAVLSDLFAISIDPKKSLVFNELIKETEIKNAKVKSKRLLKNILNNFSFFQISTLDKFNHRLIRSFSSELGLGYDFELVVDRDEFFDLLIFEFLDKIDENKPTLKLLSNYSKTKVLENKSWDIDYELRTLIRLIFDETNYSNFLKISQDEGLSFYELKKEISKTKTSLKKSLNNKINQFFTLTENKEDHIFLYILNFIKNISRKKISDIKTDPFRKRFSNHEVFKKSFKSENTDEILKPIIAIVKKILDDVDKLNTYNNINKNIDLNILAVQIIKFSNKFQDESNILFISDFNKKINKELFDQTPSFIYERLSVKFKDYFIDEFQDTSSLQWENIIPLSSHSILNEELNERSGSMFIVGDPKQSIYRWRGANPETFSSLKKRSPFFIKPETKTNKDNFRSCEQIVEFNNDFFKFISSRLKINAISDLYCDLKQKPKKSLNGQITFSFTDKYLNQKDIKIEDEELMPSICFDIIKDKIKNGYNYRDIAVLCRTNAQCDSISSFLIEKNVNVKSDEVSAISSNKEIEILIHFLGLKLNPNNKQHLKEILKYLSHKMNIKSKYSFIKNNINSDLKSFFKNILDLDFYNFYNNNDYNSIIYLVKNLNFFDKQLLYVQFLLEEIFNYQTKTLFRKSNFCEYWNQTKERLKVNIKNESDSVNVLTIHSAKGMEYPCVILPHFEYKLKQNNFKIWIQYESSKIKTPLLADYNKSLIFFNDETKALYEEKNDEMILDSINLTYVALSRAIKENNIISTTPKEENLDYLNTLLLKFIEEKGFTEDDTKSFYQYTYGENPTKKTNNSTRKIEEIKTLSKIDAHSFRKMDKILNNTKNVTYFGSIFHDLISKIERKSQVKMIVDQFFNRGLFSSLEKKKVLKMLELVFNNPKLKHYFDVSKNIFNEREIYLPGNVVIKPDKIIFHSKNEVSILDYKTGNPNINDKNQLKHYLSCLEKNSFKVREALLVYIGEKLSVINLSRNKTI